jgi:translation initiation factor 2B subunit (eIF-2B alpha/beta/delta family)
MTGEGRSADGTGGGERTHVVTCFLREGSRVLFVRRSDAATTYPGRWAGVSGYVERLDGDGPVDAAAEARREVREETGVDVGAPTRAGDPLRVDDAGRAWTVHPFLFDVPTRDVAPSGELAAAEWRHPTAALEAARPTVPGLWEAYERVAPTVADVAGDREHGSATVSLLALAVLRDRAGAVAAGRADAEPDDRSAVARVARRLRDARPSMAAVANRVNRATSEGLGGGGTPAAVRDAAARVADQAAAADERAARAAARLAQVDGRDDAPLVATLSRSSTVRAALLDARPAVLVGESRPAREGVGVAEALADAGLDVTLTTDAALPWLAIERGADAVLVGADAVLADGTVVNKAGTRALCAVAADEDVPAYAVAARDKVRPDERFHGEAGDAATVYDGDAPVAVAAPTFDATPPGLLAGVVTEAGVLDAADVREVAASHREAAAWDDADAA